MISTIYIGTYKFDMRWTRICVASIRHWYPDIPIVLIKDFGAGDFDTSELERAYQVKLFPTQRKLFGWGFGKLEPLFIDRPHKFVVLDADTVFTGPVLDSLNRRDEEFLVDDETPTKEDVTRLYFKLASVRQFDPEFAPCGRNFNSGQWVGTSGLVNRSDFKGLVSWETSPPTLLRPDCFMPGDQGVLNYLLEKLANSKRISLGRVPLMWWAPRDLNDVKLDQLAASSPYARIIHWAGCKMYGKDALPRADILKFFEDEYYAKVGKSPSSRYWRHFVERLNIKLHAQRRRIQLRLAMLRRAAPLHSVSPTKR